MPTDDRFVRAVQLTKNHDGLRFEAMDNAVASPAMFLSALPCGAYTCLRFSISATNASAAPLGLDFHKERLLQSLKLLGVTEEHLWIGESEIESVVNEVARHVPQGLHASCLLTVLATVETVPRLYGHVVGPLRINTLQVDNVLLTTRQVGDGNRMGRKSRAKASSWIEERGPLEALKKEVCPTANEVVMTTRDGKYVLEGLITNVFVVVEMGSGEKRVFTAENDVLHGQMRDLVIQVCREMGISVVLQAPRMDEISCWKEMFLTSVTKPVCIVRQMTWAETNMTIAFETDGVAKRIQKQLAEVL